MNLLDEIFALRQPLGLLRQPTRRLDLEKCRNALGELGVGNPYDLTAEQMNRLLLEPSLATGAKGREASLPSKDFLYRLTYVPRIVHDKGLVWKKSFGPQRSSRIVWKKFLDDFRQENDWLPLGRYVTGRLHGFREFTWWTSFEGLLSKPGIAARKLGLSEVGVRGLILRFPIGRLSQEHAARIPTCLDGFFSLIFHPAPDEPEIGAGVAVDLSDTSNICNGVDEYVLGPLDVSHLEVIPVSIGRNQHQQSKILPTESFLRAVKSFYSLALSRST